MLNPMIQKLIGCLALFEAKPCSIECGHAIHQMKAPNEQNSDKLTIKNKNVPKNIFFY